MRICAADCLQIAKRQLPLSRLAVTLHNQNPGWHRCRFYEIWGKRYENYKRAARTSQFRQPMALKKSRYMNPKKTFSALKMSDKEETSRKEKPYGCVSVGLIGCISVNAAIGNQSQ